MKTYNTAPYYDDFVEDNKFYKILFRPGYAVQARELTQLQTTLQNQIKRHGDHIFKDGAMVIPGQMSIDTKVKYVKLQTTSVDVTNFIGQIVTGDSGLQAQVVHAVAAENTDVATLFVHYQNSADDTVTKVFASAETLTVGTTTVTAAASAATGDASIATIERGVYYVGGYFVLVTPQTIILNKYDSTPSYRVGLLVDEQTITPEDNDLLLDNAQGSYNYAAPGAHRYYIDLTLTKKDLSSTDDASFIELLRVDGGSIQRHVTKTEYSELEKTLARRTYDESGNYTVRPFTIDVREHRNNNRGLWTTATAYIIGDVVESSGVTYVAKRAGTSSTIAPVHTSGTAYDGPGNTGVQWEYNQSPFYNRGVYTPEDGGLESKLAIGLEPGKAYVEGYEIEKIATEYVAVDKSRESVQVDNAVIPATVGNYVLVTNVNAMPPVDSFGTVTLYNRLTTSVGAQPGGTAVGTARVRVIEWDNGTIGTQAAIYKLGLFDVQMTSGYEFSRDVKSFYYNVSSDVNLSFTADVSAVTTRLVGSATASGSTTITGAGTSFQTDLKTGDYISLGGTIRRVVTISSQTSIVVDTAATVTGVTIDRLSTTIKEPENTSLVYNLPYYAIKTARSALNTNDITYTVYEVFTNQQAGSDLGSTCELTVSTSNGTFASAAETDNYTLIYADATSGGVVVAPTSINVSGSSVTFVLPDTYAGKLFNVVGAVNKSGATLTEKSKTLVLAGDTGTVITKTTAATATTREILLGKADCYRLVSVKMKTGTFASPGSSYSIDITDRYDFDNGQRATHYDVGRIVLKASYQPPVAPIEITFEYFTHSTGDYFTVNSYGDYSTDISNTSNIAYSSIPLFNGVPLSDAIDFRPRMADDGSGFSGAGAVLSMMPKRGIDIRADYRYYLARKTKIAINFNGEFFAIDGVSSLNPGDPLDPSMGMVLYNLTLEPYTFGTSPTSVAVQMFDNKRYTMRDIGKLEKRIDNLEYYTSLSLLEQQTESLDIIDSDGLDRFKNGFIVDSFTGHNTGNAASPDYMCAIDMASAELRPFFAQNNINLIEKNTTNVQRAASNYQLYGDVITLPVTEHIPLVKQEFASRLENINPFAIFTFLGNVTLTPSSDDWFEVDRRPDIVNDVEGNFNTLKIMAEKSGVLGTVWNAWQTQWTGTPVAVSGITYTAANPGWGNGVWANQRALSQGATQISYDEMVQRFGAGNAFGNPARQVTVNTYATQVGQSRTGTKTSIVAKIDRQVVADRVLQTAAIPYIRSRNVLVQVKGLKPGTRFYPFFDDVDVSAYCTSASRMVYTPGTGTFDDSSNVGGLASDVERRINGDSQVCLNRGDVIRGSSSNATAVVIGKEYNPDTGVYALYVVNVKGTFTTSDTITGNVSSATGTFVSLAAGSTGGNLVSNFNGDVSLLFNIPNTTSIRFRTGIREFKLVDTETATGSFTSRGRAQYRAQGVLETRQQTVNAVRNAELVQEQVADNRVVVSTSERVVADTGWYDPLAQTFLVQQKGGAFLTKIDVFFASKDSRIPVNLEIREVVNGYPGKLVLPFSKVSMKPEQINLSSTMVMVDGVSTPKYDTPTTFTFASPVYVQDNTEYAIILSSDSNNYKVWISQLGDQVPGSSRTISEQPYMGVFFKSQNASTWTADQTQDLKFTIYRAKFDTNVIGNIEFVNDLMPYQALDVDPFETRAGQTKVRVYQRDHGMPAGSRVIISNADETAYNGVAKTGTISTTTGSADVTGVGTSFTTELVAGSVIYNAAGTYIGVVSSITNNTSLTLVSNTAVVVTTANFKATAPINGIPSTEIYTTHIISDVDFDQYCVTVASAPTSTGYAGGSTVRATRNLQFDTVQPAVQLQTFSDTLTTFGIKAASGKSVDSGSQTPYVVPATFTDVLSNENNNFATPRMISSEVNEINSQGGAKSVTMNVTMATANDALSPILDTQRTSLIVVSNKINSPTETNINVGGLDANVILSGSANVSISGNQITTSDSATKEVFLTAKVGKYLTIAGASSGTSTRLITAIAADGSSITFASNPEAVTGNVTLTQREMYVDEIAPSGSSSYSKYVTKRVNLANPSSFLRVRFAASIPADAAVEVYYKTSTVGSTASFEDTSYTQVVSDAPVVYVQQGSNQFVDMTFSTGDIDAFDAVQVKLVLKSTNTAAVPRIKDLRVIACA